jgi:hypothetical protein
VDKVLQLLSLDLSFADAVKAALEKTIEQLAAENKLQRPRFSDMLNGRMVPDDRQLAALIGELGGTRDEWLDLWFAQARMRAKAHASAKVRVA